MLFELSGTDLQTLWLE